MEAKKKSYYYERQKAGYLEGNAARQLNAAPDIRRERKQQEEHSRRRRVHDQPQALTGMSFGSLFVLAVAIVITMYVCIDYLKVNSEVAHMDNEIINLENDLKLKKSENAAAYEAIDMTFDLAYIYQVAIEELGMVYPDNNTVITYKSGEDSYVRQYEDIPE